MQAQTNTNRAGFNPPSRHNAARTPRWQRDSGRRDRNEPPTEPGMFSPCQHYFITQDDCNKRPRQLKGYRTPPNFWRSQAAIGQLSQKGRPCWSQREAAALAGLTLRSCRALGRDRHTSGRSRSLTRQFLVLQRGDRLI